MTLNVNVRVIRGMHKSTESKKVQEITGEKSKWPNVKVKVKVRSDQERLVKDSYGKIKNGLVLSGLVRVKSKE